MTVPDHGKPSFQRSEAARVAESLYGIRGRLQALPSERDQNFLLETEEGQRFILKIANSSERPEILDLQNRALDLVAHSLEEPVCPRLIPTREGQACAQVEGPEGECHYVRLLSHLPGIPLAEFRPHGRGLLQALGRMMAAVDRALDGFEHPAAERPLRWDMQRAPEVLSEFKPEIEPADRRELVEAFEARWQEHVAPYLGRLRRAIIHNDANDYNVIVHQPGLDQAPQLSLLDFGDMLKTFVLSEVAIAAAYALLDKPDPLSAAAEVLRGYHAGFPLEEVEVALLYDFIAMRLCTSVAIAAHQKKLDPSDAYLTISEAPAWRALATWEQIHPRLTEATFREACGWDPLPDSMRLQGWLRAKAGSFAPVLEGIESLNHAPTLDLSVGSSLLDRRAIEDPAGHFSPGPSRIPAIGAYGENRAWNTREAFRVQTNWGPSWRTLHLGIDLFAPEGTGVHAPLCGRVHSLQDNREPWDYGPTLILEHGTEAGSFYTLYGHLSRSSLDSIQAGQDIAAGEPIGSLGTPDENGGWPPHLHLQIITDLLGHHGIFPGAALPEQGRVWRAFSPDPAPLLGLPESPARAAPDPDLVLHHRRRHFSGALSLAYRRPLAIMRGAGCHLIDEQGRAYLDCVNNVCHVGHCHSRVVDAVACQMGVLNTNTRYLHPLRTAYAERLTERLPEPLRVCFLVNSGSEANDLALRLARAHTGGTEIIVLDGAYHGNLSSLIAISPYKFDGPGGEGAPPYVHKVPMPDVYRGLYRGDEAEAGRKYAAEVERAIEGIQRQGRRLAAFIAEPLMSVAGQIVPPPGFLSAAFEAVRQAGGVCIADEVQIGFGRVGSHFWGFESQDAMPDIVTMGKPIANGHPLAAVLTTPEIAASFETGMEYFNTFGGNPVSCAAGLAVLEVIEGEGLQENARRVGTYLKEGLRELMVRHTLIGDVRGEGLFIGVELVRDRQTLEPADAEAYYVIERAKDLGVLLSVDGPLHNVLKIKPPLVFSQADADRLLETLDTVMSDSVLQR